MDYTRDIESTMSQVKLTDDERTILRSESMTYKEYFMQFDSVEKIMKEANQEMAFAAVLNPDRIKMVRQAAEEVINEKFGNEKPQ